MWYALRIVDLTKVELQVAIGNVESPADERRPLGDGFLYGSESGLEILGRHVSMREDGWMDGRDGVGLRRLCQPL